jgi:hypothetical protein
MFQSLSQFDKREKNQNGKPIKISIVPYLASSTNVPISESCSQLVTLKMSACSCPSRHRHPHHRL